MLRTAIVLILVCSQLYPSPAIKMHLQHHVDAESRSPKWIGIAADHGGYELKAFLVGRMVHAGYQVIDFGNWQCDFDDDYPDFVVPLAFALVRRNVARGIAICGSGVGATIAANKIAGIRACLINDAVSAHQGVEDDNLNMICLGGLVVGHALAWELVQTFLGANFSGAERHLRRVEKVAELENRRIQHSAVPSSLLGSQASYRQSVTQAKADWRYEGNPN